jgi:hypothetical protein
LFTSLVVLQLLQQEADLTGSRVVWTFAKHLGWPDSKSLGRNDPKSQIPINTVMTTSVSGMAITVLEVELSLILNGALGAASMSFFFSYGMPIWCYYIVGVDSFQRINISTWEDSALPSMLFIQSVGV